MADAARVRDIVDLAPRWTGADAIRLNQMFRGRDSAEMLHAVFADDMLGPTALVSSFGAESAVLLHLVGSIRADVPVIFLDTGKHFAETIAYRDALARQIGLTNIINVTPDAQEIAARDANGLRWSYDPDGCCALRKVAPLAGALLPFDAHISGRKAFQSASRANLPRFEVDGDGRMKVNPLVDWDKAALDAYVAAHALPPHPLVAQGYLSIGCAPCTSIVKPGEDPRSGRWAGWDKVECGIHTPTDGDDGTNDPVF